MKPRVLIIDDEESMARSLREILATEGYEALTASTARAGLEAFQRHNPELVICDIRLPDRSGIEVLREIRAQDADACVIMMTAYAKVETAIEALKLGASDYLLKPIRFDDLLHRMSRLLDHRRLEIEAQSLRRSVRTQRLRSTLIGESKALTAVRDMIDRVAATDSTVLITGESGTGKDLIASEVHQRSPRASGPFLAVNCSAIPESLLESELFGYRKGAFSGADRDKDGMLALAHGGTLFLDEVGDLPLPLQPKLLRVIEKKEFMPLGGTSSVRADVRFLAASNQDLKSMVDRSDFRLDLFYRLSLLEINAPPLRDITDDIPLLARHFLDDLNQKLDKAVRGFQASALSAMIADRWPGNVRELENRIHRAVILCDTDELTRADIWPEAGHRNASTNKLREAVRSFELSLIRQALERHGGDKRQAAEDLGISVATLYAKLKNGHDGDTPLSRDESSSND